MYPRLTRRPALTRSGRARARSGAGPLPVPPRLVDIAEAVGVHVSTVSRVLNGDPAQSIRPEVYRKILSTARQQPYGPTRWPGR